MGSSERRSRLSSRSAPFLLSMIYLPISLPIDWRSYASFRLDMDAPIGPFGTKEALAIIQSYYDKRIVGCPGGEGEDEHDIVWFWLEKGKPHECPMCMQYFMVKESLQMDMVTIMTTEACADFLEKNYLDRKRAFLKNYLLAFDIFLVHFLLPVLAQGQEWFCSLRFSESDTWLGCLVPERSSRQFSSESGANVGKKVLLLGHVLTWGEATSTAFSSPRQAALVYAVIIALTVWLSALCVAANRRTASTTTTRSPAETEGFRLQYSFFRKVAGLPQRFSFRELEAATDSFQAQLGRGASGAVFKGILEDGTPVAVKRIDGGGRGEKEFKSEITVIANAQHVNLVRLLGYCVAPGELYFLVYEFIENGSLDNWIFPWREQGRCLAWPLRYQVAIDVAKALAYLHHDCRARILHLDIKPENILLDENFRAVVADFGLSKLVSRDQSRVMMSVRGTKGYLAPEWLLDCGITEKSDVYSYGMMLLELVGGCRNVHAVGAGIEQQWSYFPKKVADKVREERIMDVVDGRLMPMVDEGGGDGDCRRGRLKLYEKQVKSVVYVALWCIQEEAELRPSMPRVVDMLEGRMPVEVPPETEMIMVELLSIEDQDGKAHEKISRPPGLASAWKAGSQTSTASCSYSFSTSIMSGR